ncbi:hypothetical protein DEU37_2334 [Microbacterium sp. AG790]|uniref:hypothetical protein n=1 Tax=Microbacterium sp. AG790 TaxID=2183995 RepID=UPI000EB11C74|nr:hypothetical protein [Microbacterium sp. AG790]RKS86680.1 hypothetical protein DEU37_2334 [Microbacterium sp. AG790]
MHAAGDRAELTDEYAYVIVETGLQSRTDADAENSDQIRHRWSELNEWGAMGYELLHTVTISTGSRTTIFDTLQLHVRP